MLDLKSVSTIKKQRNNNEKHFKYTATKAHRRCSSVFNNQINQENLTPKEWPVKKATTQQVTFENYTLARTLRGEN